MAQPFCPSSKSLPTIAAPPHPLTVAKDQPEIDEIKVATHYLGVQLTSTERAIELEMYQIVDESGIATKTPRGPTSRLPDDKVDRIRENLKDCTNAIEVLLLRTCFVDWPSETNDTHPSEAMIIQRKKQYTCFISRFSFIMHKAVYLHGRFVEAIPELERSSPWVLWINELTEGENVVSLDVHTKILNVIRTLEYKPEDKVLFERDPKDRKSFDPRLVQLMAALSMDKKQDPRVDFVEPWDFNAYFEHLQSTVLQCRHLAREMNSRIRGIRFMKTLQNCQAWAADPRAPAKVRTCSRCGHPCTKPEITRVVGPCGHMFCDACFADIPRNRGICTMENCDAVMVQDSQYTAQVLGADDGNAVRRRYGAKLGEIIKLVREKIPTDEQVLLFVQFDKIMEWISASLEAQNITNYALYDKNKSMHGKLMSKFQNERTPNAKKMLILNATKDAAAGV